MIRKGGFSLGKRELQALYKFHSTARIAEMFGVNPETVRKRMITLGIERRQIGGQRQFSPPRRDLERLYQTMSMAEIAKRYGVGETVVWKRLNEHGIKLKDYEKGGHRLRPGRVFSPEHRQALSRARAGRFAGSENPNWQGGITGRNLRLRGSLAYRQWRMAALVLAGNACQNCGVKDGATCKCCGTSIKLHVHHFESFAKNVHRRFDPSNSEVLCPKCHYSRHRGKTW